MLGQVRKHIFGISPKETSVVERGFTVSDPVVKERLEEIGRAFVAGYHAALLDPNPAALAARLHQLAPELHGFAFEGAGMGLTLLDILSPWRRTHLRDFLAGPGDLHAYIVQVGAGWALARLRRPVENWLDRLDPTVKWLALDGYGFHDGYFHWPRYLEKQEEPAQLSGYARRGFDLGLGRSLWFVKGANVERVIETLAPFPINRQRDIWSGVGLAAAYAGGVDRPTLEQLTVAAADFRPNLAQGVIFAAGTRHRAGNPAAHTDLACQTICRMSFAEAARCFTTTGTDLPNPSSERETPAFEIWRQRIQAQFIPQEALTR